MAMLAATMSNTIKRITSYELFHYSTIKDRDEMALFFGFDEPVETVAILENPGVQLRVWANPITNVANKLGYEVERYEETYPLASIVRYNFAARGDMPAVKFTWYDGGLKPPRPEELEENRPMKIVEEEEDEGLLFVGDRGKILCGFNGSHPRLVPQTKMEAYKPPPQTLPRSPGNTLAES